MECIIELNSLCKHIKQVRSSQPTILYTKLKKAQFFLVSIVNGIYSHHEISEESKAHIEASQNVLSKKGFIKEGKERIREKLFVKKKKTCLYQSVYSSSLQLMKRYVKIFQQAEPAVFRIHREELDIFKEFLINFIEPEVSATNN